LFKRFSPKKHLMALWNFYNTFAFIIVNAPKHFQRVSAEVFKPNAFVCLLFAWLISAYFLFWPPNDSNVFVYLCVIYIFCLCFFGCAFLCSSTSTSGRVPKSTKSGTPQLFDCANSCHHLWQAHVQLQRPARFAWLQRFYVQLYGLTEVIKCMAQLTRHLRVLFPGNLVWQFEN